MTNRNPENTPESTPKAGHASATGEKVHAETPRAAQEIEIKFSVTDNTPVPNLSTLGEVQSETVHRLSATYYDTEDLRLFRSKITLRHRKGGKDDGWHIKFPGVISRLEVQAPDSPSPTDEFLEPVRAIIRDRPLVRIATIDNERHETMLDCGEFVDDHVTAVSLLRHGKKTTWREWEFEFHGEPTAETRGQVANLLRSTGAMEATSPSKLRTALGSSVRYAPVPAQPVALDSPLPLRNIFTTLNANYRELINLDPYMRGMGDEVPAKAFYKAALSIRSAMGLCTELLDDDELHEELAENLLRIDALLEALADRNEEEYLEFLRSYDYYAVLDGIEVILGQKWDEVATVSTMTAVISRLMGQENIKHPRIDDLSRLALVRTALLALPKSAKLVRATSEAMNYLAEYLQVKEETEVIFNKVDATSDTNEAFELGRQCAKVERVLAKKLKKFQASMGSLNKKLANKYDVS
ncbi:MAG: CYTH domain-containing protein [Corynebacterium sp.]|nr:CYTH domain-containing protein [Corynebacterium sp.]